MGSKAPSPIDLHVARRIRRRRMMLKLSQGKLGDALGLTFQQVQKYENGINRISASRLHDIAWCLKVEPAYFFEGAPAGKARRSAVKAPVADFLKAFPHASEDFALAKSFPKIKDRKTRRCIVALVQRIADES
jgi:transcriptional regulator with XRE-family HTH domain